MIRMVLISSILMAALLAVLRHAPASADPPAGVRIVLIQATGSDAKFERIDIKNQSDTIVDMTGWKLLYKSYTGGSTTELVQLTAESNWHVLIDAGASETFVSKELVAALPFETGLKEAIQFTAGMNHTGGSVQLVDSQGAVVDMIGWGTATEPVRQGTAAAAMTATTWLVRQGVTGNNASDFVLEPQNSMLRPVSVGMFYEVQDICGNLEGIQLIVPEGYSSAGGACSLLDVCINLEGVQAAMPDGMEYDSEERCAPIDMCLNLEGIQERMPNGYELVASRSCELSIPLRLLMITEILPNPSGSDAGNEFIELYNADTEAVSLKNYQLAIGAKTYALPDQSLPPEAYLTLSDIDLGGSLPNTTGLPMWLMTIRDIEVAAVPAYANAKDDVSWAFIDGQWQYTYVPTPGEANVAMAAPPCQEGYARDPGASRCRKLEVATMATSLTLCRDGQYRSEETGRCRNLPIVSALAPCKEGQYRSEETKRCRSLVSTVASGLTPCADDQFRNPLTNRCKKIASMNEGALADCGEGRERNPVTNRCRNVTKAAAPAAAFAVEPVKDQATAFVGWWAMGGVGTLALGYAGWEWRREVLAGVAKIREAFIRR